MAALNHATVIKGLEALNDIRLPDEFFFEFLKAFKFPAATVKRLRDPKGNRNIAKIPGDYALEKEIYYHPGRHDEDLAATLKARINDPALEKIRFFLSTNFEVVVAYDRRVDDWTSFDIADLPRNYEFFLPLTGLFEKELAYNPHPADLKASKKMGMLYDEIRSINHFDKTNLHDLNVFLTRLLFCFFAEDTGIFPQKAQMTKAIESTTQEDGSDLANFFEHFFWVLDMEKDRPARRHETATLAAFPYVNGGLFREKIRIPTFNARARRLLIECGRLEWNEVSPVIFGSMFQAVMDPKIRHIQGSHYTSEENIFKVIGPLFLNDLKEELGKLLSDKSTHRVKRLKEYQKKLASLRFLDPACGCGNFLVITYRELKKLELTVAKAIYAKKGESLSLFDDWQKEVSQVSINQFSGFELEEFPVDVARVSMWLMEHVMNLQFGEYFGAVFPSIPLRDSANILCANSLRIDWERLSVHFIFGNPPFAGAGTTTQEQKDDLHTVFGKQSIGRLDYVAGWFRLSANYMEKHPETRTAFVSTNSICQGQQVATLWQKLFDQGFTINFAHRTFRWSNEAKDVAAVYCVIVGFSKVKGKSAELYTYATVKSEAALHVVDKINGYLIPSNFFGAVAERTKPFSAGVPPMRFGNMPADGGFLIIEPDELDDFQDPEVQPFIKNLVGAREFLHGKSRYCLWLHDAPQSVLEKPSVAQRVKSCREWRAGRNDDGTRKLAERPHEFRDLNNPESAIVVPATTTERREYIPMGYICKDTVSTNLNQIIPNGTVYEFGILESLMHMTWMRTVCGRLKSDYRYSKDLCYNTFPWPKVTDTQRQIIENLAEKVLITREYYPDMTLAEMYDPDKMPEDLRKAHQELDLAVDRLYRKKPFENEEERLHHLFARYEKLVKGEDATSLFDEE